MMTITTRKKETEKAGTLHASLYFVKILFRGKKKAHSHTRHIVTFNFSWRSDRFNGRFIYSTLVNKCGYGYITVLTIHNKDWHNSMACKGYFFGVAGSVRNQ